MYLPEVRTTDKVQYCTLRLPMPYYDYFMGWRQRVAPPGLTREEALGFALLAGMQATIRDPRFIPDDAIARFLEGLHAHDTDRTEQSPHHSPWPRTPPAPRPGIDYTFVGQYARRFREWWKHTCPPGLTLIEALSYAVLNDMVFAAHESKTIIPSDARDFLKELPPTEPA